MRVRFDELTCSAQADTSSTNVPRCRALNAVLLAAGYGTRIRSLFPDTPKALIEVGGRALIDHLLANLARSGLVDSALVVTNDRYHDALRRHLAAAGRIVDFKEKPERPKSNIASLAVYVLTPAARELLDDYLRGGGNRDAPGHFLSWLTRATAVYGYLTEGGAYDVGTPESYAEAQRAFRAMRDDSPG